MPRLCNQLTIGLWPNAYAYIAHETQLYMPIARDARHLALQVRQCISSQSKAGNASKSCNEIVAGNHNGLATYKL